MHVKIFIGNLDYLDVQAMGSVPDDVVAAMLHFAACVFTATSVYFCLILFMEHFGSFVFISL